MRDPKRIDRILDKVKKLWQEYPDYRFGQMVWNLSSGIDSNIFHIEDDLMETLIDDQLKNHGCSHPGVFRGELCKKCGGRP